MRRVCSSLLIMCGASVAGCGWQGLRASEWGCGKRVPGSLRAAAVGAVYLVHVACGTCGPMLRRGMRS